MPAPGMTRQVLGLIIGPLAVYAYAIYISWTGQEGDATPRTVWGWVYGTAFYAVGLAGWLFLIYRFVCRQPLAALNRKPGKIGFDFIHGLILAVVLNFVGTTFNFLNHYVFHFGTSGQIENMYTDLLHDPWGIFMLMGPYTFLAAAMYEEFLRVFMLERMLALWDGRVVVFTAITLSSILFGLCHIYQGPVGIINSLLFGLVLAGYYYRFGRVLPMMLGHGFYNFYCIGVGLIMTALGLY